MSEERALPQDVVDRLAANMTLPAPTGDPAPFVEYRTDDEVCTFCQLRDATGTAASHHPDARFPSCGQEGCGVDYRHPCQYCGDEACGGKYLC